MGESFLKDDLVNLRKELGLTQQEMADRLDMAVRAYQAIEAGESEYRLVHRLAAERVALMIAVDKKDADLVPAPVRDDAIELIRIGRLTGKPPYTRDGGKGVPPPQISETNRNARFRAAYAVVGELVLLSTALDHQLNHVVIEVLPLTGSPMLESVVATLDMVRKIEMLKARASHIHKQEWRKPVLSYLDKLERVSKWRNLACHNVLIPDEKHGAVFAPAAAARLLKSLQLGEEPVSKRTPIDDLKPILRLGEEALGAGENLIQNFRKANAERERRHGK